MRVALVTGAGNGLGSVLAAGLHAEGCRVAVTDVDGAAASAVAAALDPAGESAFALTLDVLDKSAFERALAALLERWGAAHVLVNNAALTIARPAMAIEAAEFDLVMAVNVRGTFFGCQVFGAHFKAQGHGRIVNISSLAAQNGGTATGAHYGASKGAIITLTKVFARELGPSGVTVNAVAPGPLDLPIVHRTITPEGLTALRKAIPVGDIGNPRFVASVVAHLASPEAAFVNGATWDMNGGLFTR